MTAGFDLNRLSTFLRPKNPAAADRVKLRLRQGARSLLSQPRMGQRVSDIGEREIRRIIVGDYEMRYEIIREELVILRIWHCREDR